MKRELDEVFNENELLEITRTLIEIDSSTACATRERNVAAYLLELFRREGIPCDLLEIEDGKRAALICALNILSILKSELGDLDLVKQFIQVIGFVRSGENFGSQPQVINGASELFKELYGEAGLATRLAIGTNEIPGGAAMEILAVVEV